MVIPRSIHRRWKIHYLLALNSFYCCCLCCLCLFYSVAVFCRDHLFPFVQHHLFHLPPPKQINQCTVSVNRQHRKLLTKQLKKYDLRIAYSLLCYHCCAKKLVAMRVALDPVHKDRSPYHFHVDNFFENAPNDITAAIGINEFNY